MEQEEQNENENENRGVAGWRPSSHNRHTIGGNIPWFSKATFASRVILSSVHINSVIHKSTQMGATKE